MKNAFGGLFSGCETTEENISELDDNKNFQNWKTKRKRDQIFHPPNITEYTRTAGASTKDIKYSNIPKVKKEKTEATFEGLMIDNVPKIVRH